MRTIYKLGVLILAVAFTACQNDMDNVDNPNEEITDSSEIIITDGVIQSPKWLVHIVDSVAHLYQPSPATGEYPCPPVYSVKYKNQEYILILDWLESCAACGEYFYTLSGDMVDKSSDLFDELMTNDKQERTLLWWPGGKDAVTKAISTTWTLTSVNTPNLHPVSDTYTRTEGVESSDIPAILSHIASTYPQATVLGPLTTTYNCHAYAWYMTAGGSSPVWMGRYTNPTNAYWNDYSYVSAAQSNATKVAYLSDNHSAVTTGTYDVFISKWGEWPLMRHPKNQSPYNASNVSYYRRFNPPPYYIGRAYDEESGSLTISANGSGYASVALNAYKAPTTPTSPNSYVWSVTNAGNCNRWYIYPNGSRADISVYLNPSGMGTLRLECKMYNGNTLLGTGTFYLYINQ